MTQPTRQEIIRAYKTLNDLRIFLNAKGDLDSDTIKYTMSVIEKALLPKPPETMADIEWDDDLHYLAEAEHPDYGKVIMLGLEMHGLIDFFTSSDHTKRCLAVERETLTPTGKRYILTEVEE
ncbi:hypothetical protein [Corynebacterium sp. KPL2825]|uniref:hypothetical protein n=1 Tax=Corynebacterium sp. KPL2825 TaxID=3135444 RepID=UPI0030C9B2E0